jgi:integrase
MTVDEAAQAWLAFKRRNVRPSTAARYRWIVRKLVSPYFEGRKVGELQTCDFQQFADWLAFPPMRQKRPTHTAYGISTVKDAVQVLRMVHRYAGIFHQVVPLASYHFDWPRTGDYYDAKRVKALSDAEAKRLHTTLVAAVKDGASAYGRRYALGAILGLRCGMRIGEVCGFAADTGLDTEASAVKVEQAIVSYQDDDESTVCEMGPPKTEKSRRTIPVSADLARLLCDYAPATGFLIPSGTGEAKTPNKRGLSAWFARHLLDNGFKVVPFHTLRHTFATMLIKARVDMNTVSELMGHANVTVTLGIYVHTDDALKRDAVGRVEW